MNHEAQATYWRAVAEAMGWARSIEQELQDVLNQSTHNGEPDAHTIGYRLGRIADEARQIAALMERASDAAGAERRK